MSCNINMNSVLELRHSENNGRNSEGAFLDLKDGRIMFAYTHFVTAGDFGNGYIACRYSADGGRSWTSEDRVLIENDAVNVMSVSLLRVSEKRIAIFYLRKSDHINCTPYLRFSDDEGENWSKPIAITTAPGYYVGNNDRAIKYHDGRILMPTAYHRAVSSKNITGRAFDIIFYSDDGGETWQESNNWILPPQFSTTGLHEPGIVELFDRRIMAWARTDTGCQWVYFSNDRGESWGDAKPAPEFLSPTSPMQIKRNPFDGHALYAVWNDQNPRYNLPEAQEVSSWKRTPLVVAVSRDEARSWEGHTLIETDPTHGFCYPAIHFLADGILLAYCCGTSNGEPGECVLNDLRITRIEGPTITP